MRSLALATAAFASVAAAYRDWTGLDTAWATHPDKTAAWYEEHADGQLPALAPAITTVVANKSSVVKLECAGCPFRVRELHRAPESWQEPPQDNAMLLNFTIDSAAEQSTLLLNGEPIAPLAPMPLHIRAFQVNGNLSQDHMDKMTSLQMLDESCNLGTKYGRFQLQYEHTVVGSREPGKTWIQFDIAAVIYPYQERDGHGYYQLRAEGQKMVQVLLSQSLDTREMFMEEVQVIDRKDRVQPYVMECGRLAMAQTKFNPMEWDSYGQFGTWTRSFHMLLWKAGDFFFGIGGILFVVVAAVTLLVALSSRVIRRRQQLAAPADNDAEAVLLGAEHEDAPPVYDDVPELPEKVEEKA